MKNIVVLISGRGSNLEAVLSVAEAERWRETLQAAVVAVISNRRDAAGLTIARRFGVATTIIEHSAFASREAFDAALAGRDRPPRSRSWCCWRVSCAC